MVRIVSLVPSLTELCFDLGLGGEVVGRTDYCISPAEAVAELPSVGGPKTVDTEVLAALAPTHVLISPEENGAAAPAMIAACGAEAISVHPLKPEDNREIYARFGAAFGCRAAAEALCDRLDAALAEAAACRKTTPTLAVLPLIWRDPWVTVGRGTYVAGMLRAVGLETLGVGEGLYPRVDDLAAAAARADWLLPTTEPYPFSEADAEAIGAELGRVRVALTDGEAVAWYGSRAVSALPLLVAFKRWLLDGGAPRP